MLSNDLSIGQRWFSQAEPELGLGIVDAIAQRQVTLRFPAAGETRVYNAKTAPLKRHLLEPGETAVSEAGAEFVIEEVRELNGIVFYLGQEASLPETELKSDVGLLSAEEKLLAGNFGPADLFNFRYESLLLTRALQTYKARGLEGSRIRLLGHQISIYSDLQRKPWPRIVLADEVGLGKTIEAGLLIKRQIEKRLAENVLVIAPASLQYQWFVELLKKFDLVFKTLGAGDDVELTASDNDDFIITCPRFATEEEGAKALLAEKKWDLVVVDEAHRYEKGSAEFALLKEISDKAKSVCFLSATPEALGEENFFELLKMLNPQKYNSYEDFQASERSYEEAASASGEILERYNYERDLFRNRRKNLEEHKELFPKKILNALPLKIENPNEKKALAAKIDCLANELAKNPDEKFFVVGKSKKLAMAAKIALEERMSVKTALFHGDQSLLEKDRQAAYFSEPEGARVMFSAESGSEGRNFEFASHLFLLDFPLHPQLLLQRIGRLDRIGQKNDVLIHAPYVLESPEENLFKIYHRAFGLFENFPTGLMEFYEPRRELVQRLIAVNDQAGIQALSKEYKAFQTSVEEAKNRFLDAHSYKQSNVDGMREEMGAFHRKHDLQAYLEKAFNLAGVDFEELSEKTYFARPSDNMLIPSYPGLSPEGLSYTLDREKALQREDLRFMSFESPLLRGTLELFAGGEIGNTSAVAHGGKLGQNLYFEFIFKVSPKNNKGSDISFYFPLAPVRVLLDASGADHTARYPKKHVDSLAAPLEREQMESLSQGLPKQALAQLVKKAVTLASARGEKYKNQAKESISRIYGEELKKLSSWGAENDFAKAELAKIEKRKELLLEQVANLNVELDSVRLIV